MRRPQRVHEGVVDVVGYIIDVPTIGVVEARRRINAAIRSEDRLLRLDDGRWLLAQPSGSRARADCGAGLAITKVGERQSTSPDLLASESQGMVLGGAIEEARHGQLERHDPNVLPDVDLGDWFDFGEMHHLTSIHTKPIVDEVAQTEAIDVRESSGVGPLSDTATKMSKSFSDAANRSGRKRSGSRRVRTNPAGSSQRRPSRLRQRLNSALLRSPAQQVISRQHTKYLDDLQRRFATGDLAEALRRAIPTGGDGGDFTSLRLPSRRSSLGLSGPGNSGGGSVPYGQSVAHMLHTTYTDAANRLEAERRFEEALYVHVELLKQPMSGVAMLERANMLRRAAEVAEQYELDAATTVRLWWIAGDRDRAVLLARRTGAFAQVVERTRDNPELHQELRAAWADSLRSSGDLLAAIEVLLPVDDFSRVVAALVADGLRTATGPQRGQLLALRLDHDPSPEFIDEASTLLTAADHSPERQGFIEGLGERRLSDPQLDQRMATEFLRTDIVHPVSKRPGRLLERADAVLRSDLPSTGPAATTLGPVRIETSAAGTLRISDAVGLSSGATLVAAGALGVRLVNEHGRTTQRWSEPCDELVIADHENSALLVRRLGMSSDVEVRVLDLRAGSVSMYGVVNALRNVDTFDGSGWLTVDDKGAALLDMHADRPAIMWRPVEAASQCIEVVRNGPEQPTGLVQSPDGGAEIRMWDATIHRLRNRIVLPPNVHPRYRLAPGALLQIKESSIEPIRHGSMTGCDLDGDGPTDISGEHFSELVLDGSGRPELRIRNWSTSETVAVQTDADETTRMRCHGHVLTVFDQQGRLTTVDLQCQSITSAVRLSES